MARTAGAGPPGDARKADPMARWGRFVNRIRYKRMHPGTLLHVCRACCEGFVYPVTWTESGAERWWVLLRCGACDEWRDVVATNRAVADFDRVLDRGIASIGADADRLGRESLAAEADVFGRALELDLVSADDFRVQR
jgi:hypothetical protein